jgi:hypothetical protein
MELFLRPEGQPLLTPRSVVFLGGGICTKILLGECGVPRLDGQRLLMPRSAVFIGGGRICNKKGTCSYYEVSMELPQREGQPLLMTGSVIFLGGSRICTKIGRCSYYEALFRPSIHLLYSSFFALRAGSMDFPRLEGQLFLMPRSGVRGGRILK